MELIQFQPERWHACREADWLDCKDGVNCYSYILNRPEYFWSVPGDGFIKTSTQNFYKSFDAKYENVSLDDFRERLVRGAVGDGLVLVETAVDKHEYYLAALFFADNEKDFHWYRKDDDGFWSHKNGRKAASNLDDAGIQIEDPLKIKDTGYPIFGGFFRIPRSGITLTKPFPLVSSRVHGSLGPQF